MFGGWEGRRERGMEGGKEGGRERGREEGRKGGGKWRLLVSKWRCKTKGKLALPLSPSPPLSFPPSNFLACAACCSALAVEYTQSQKHKHKC